MTEADVNELGIARSAVTRKILYSAASGGLTFLIANTLEQPVATSVTLAILIGGIALVMRSLVDIERRLASVERRERAGRERLERLVVESFSKIGDATELMQLIEASTMAPGLVEELVRHSARIAPAAPAIISRFANDHLAETSELLKQLAEGGRATRYGEDRDWLLALTRSSAVSIDAVSLADVDRGLWYSEIGQRYAEAQRQAAERGVVIRRIFLRDPKAGDEADIVRACREQQRFGIRARMVERDRIPSTLHVEVLDSIVFDGVVSYETTPAPVAAEAGRPAIAETQLILREPRVLRRVEVFNALWEVAVEPDSA
ncbi:hypothetical protein [Actinoplanes sp. NPDC049681]|uniref:hypothetical protein n=1 Tax=Actinoplanes sp. NPDC049681 TaxID=3363905 RepID=UPI00379211EE